VPPRNPPESFRRVAAPERKRTPVSAGLGHLDNAAEVDSFFDWSLIAAGVLVAPGARRVHAAVLDLPKLHDLDRLAAGLLEADNVRFDEIDRPELTRWAAEGRYPDDLR
jgi:hypothetical protein